MAQQPFADFIQRTDGRLDFRLRGVEPQLWGRLPRAPGSLLGKQLRQAPAAQGIHLEGHGGGLLAAGLVGIDAMVEHQHIHFSQFSGEGGLLACLPAQLAQGDGPAIWVVQDQRLIPAGDGNQLGAAAMPGLEEGLPQGSTGSGDGHGDRPWDGSFGSPWWLAKRGHGW